MVRVAYEETAAERTAGIAFETTTMGPPVDPEGGAPLAMTGGGILDLAGAAWSLRMGITGMVDYYDFGVPAEVRPPNQTVDGSRLTAAWLPNRDVWRGYVPVIVYP